MRMGSPYARQQDYDALPNPGRRPYLCLCLDVVVQQAAIQ